LPQGAQLVATQIEIDKVIQNMKPIQSALVVGGHKFSSLKEDLKQANDKTQQLLDEKQFITNVSERQKEQNEILCKLEDDLTKQVGKNQILTLDVGRPLNLHRWRHLANANPEKWALIEKVHRLQKQSISSMDKVTSQSSIMDEKKILLAKLKQEVTSQASIDSIKSQLSQLKITHQNITKEIKANELVLQERAEHAESLKAELLELEKERMEMKTAYIVSVISSH
jgi:hypothetical protein